MKTRASRIVLICSTAVLVMLLWAGMAAAKPTPHKWSQHHRAEAKIAQQSPSEDQSDDSAAVVHRRIGKAFVAVSRPAPTAGTAGVTTVTVPTPESHAQLAARRPAGKGYVGTTWSVAQAR